MDAPDVEASCAVLDEESRRGVAALLFYSRDDHYEIGKVTVRNEMLGSIQQPAAVRARRARLHGTRIGARVRLGERERPCFLGTYGGNEEALALLAGACEQ